MASSPMHVLLPFSAIRQPPSQLAAHDSPPASVPPAPDLSRRLPTPSPHMAALDSRSAVCLSGNLIVYMHHLPSSVAMTHHRASQPAISPRAGRRATHLHQHHHLHLCASRAPAPAAGMDVRLSLSPLCLIRLPAACQGW